MGYDTGTCTMGTEGLDDRDMELSETPSEGLEVNTCDILGCSRDDLGSTVQKVSQQCCSSEEETLRKINQCHGIYISGSVQGVDVNWTTDTGATKSIISRSVYERIPQNLRPKLSKSSCLTSVSGEPLSELGKAVFEIQLGQEKLTEEMIVAEIADEALLGLDILLKEENGPVEIRLKENLIIFKGNKINFRHMTGQIRRVLAAEDFTVPAYSEQVVDVFVKLNDCDQNLQHHIFCIEPSEDFNNRFSLLMASCFSPVNLRFHMQLIAKEIIFFAKYSLVSVKQHIKNLILSNVQK